MEEKTKIFILLEGVNDLDFITGLICFSYLDDNYDTINKTKCEIILQDDNHRVHIRKMNGWTLVAAEENISTLNMKEEQGYSCILLIDADDETKDYGSFDERNKRLSEILDDKKVNCDIFLFPNNKDDGELEDVLIDIMPEENKAIYDCIDQHDKCIEHNLTQLGKLKPKDIKNKKNKIIRYNDILNGKTKVDYNEEGCLPIKNFLKTYFSHKE